MKKIASDRRAKIDRDLTSLREHLACAQEKITKLADLIKFDEGEDQQSGGVSETLHLI